MYLTRAHILFSAIFKRMQLFACHQTSWWQLPVTLCSIDVYKRQSQWCTSTSGLRPCLCEPWFSPPILILGGNQVLYLSPSCWTFNDPCPFHLPNFPTPPLRKQNKNQKTNKKLERKKKLEKEKRKKNFREELEKKLVGRVVTTWV